MRLKPKAKESSEPMFITLYEQQQSLQKEGRVEITNFRMVEVFQLSNTAWNETQDFY